MEYIKDLLKDRFITLFMRPQNQAARDRLLTTLARRANVSASELAEALGVSVPTLHRMLPAIAEQLAIAGRARRTRYAQRRTLRGRLTELPLYQVDKTGRAAPVAPLVPIRPRGSLLRLPPSQWPLLTESTDGWWQGLPYPIYDMRPQGYMGRQTARAEHERLGVSIDPDEWNDDDILHVLSQVGSDMSGNLILGDAAMERWQLGKFSAAAPIKPRGLSSAYARLADRAVAAGAPGSSTAGEFPKFTAMRERPGSDAVHVLVKFSGADGSATVQRWADLLVCEHLALQHAATLPGIDSAHSRIVIHNGRTFLETERFDRHGEAGRSALISLSAIDAALLGEGSSDWCRLAKRLALSGLLSAHDLQRIEHLWWFGRLIANADMHTGNLSFGLAPQPPAMFLLAPAYDMLPMLYAPLPGGELPARRLVPVLPMPEQRATWLAACTAALSFWSEAAIDSRISPAFRLECSLNHATLGALAAKL